MDAPRTDVLLSNGETVPFETLYREKPLVLVFLRHLGCTFCREQVAQLRFSKSLNIAFVAMASPAEAETFRQKHRCPHPFICDPEATLYAHFGLEKGKARQLFSSKVFARGFGATLRGHWVGLPIGDPWQMPGIFLIGTDGKLEWEYRARDVADNLTEEQVLRQISHDLPSQPTH